MDILNLNIIFFGLNFFKLISTIFCYLKINFKHKKLIIYFICSIGLINHLWFIWSQIVNGDLIYSQFYISPDFIDAPDLFFCSEKSDELNLSNLFDRIIFLDKASNQWKNSSFKSSNQNDLRIENFQFSNQKCLRIISSIKYEKDQFEYTDSTSVIKIYFNRSIIHQQNDTINFLTKTKDTNQFSKISFISFIDVRSLAYMTSISHELYEINFHDKFSLVKNTLSFFNKANALNVDELLKKAIDEFERRQNVEKKKFSFNLKLEKLFEKFSREVEDGDQQLKSKLIKKFTINYLNQQIREDDPSYPDFIFSIIFFKRVILASNSENFTKLILNVMSLFEFWYYANFLELYVYSYKIRDFFIYLKK